MAHSGPDIAQWLAAARGGSRDALGDALETCRRYLLRIASDDLDADLRAKGGASDLVQQTFLEAQQAFAQFHGQSEDELRAWLRHLLRNNVADFTRHYRGTAKRSTNREVSLQPETPSGRCQAEVALDTPSPIARAAAHEQEEAVRRAMDKLPKDYQRVIVLRHQEGRSFEEIAALLGRTLGATRKLWLRAVERLQQQLEAP